MKQPAQVQNLGLVKDGAIAMDAERSDKFHSTLHALWTQVESLEAASRTFVGRDLDEGEMDPFATVQAFYKGMDENIQILYAMIECEEMPPAPKEQKGGADE